MAGISLSMATESAANEWLEAQNALAEAGAQGCPVRRQAAHPVLSASQWPRHLPVLPEEAMSPMRRILSFRDFDWALLGLVLLLCAVSVLEVHSATVHTRFASFGPSRFSDCGRAGDDVYPPRSTTTACSTGLPGLTVFLVSLVAVSRRGTQGAGRTALDRARPDAISAFGVGEAGADPDGGALFCQSWGPQPDLEGHLQGVCAGGDSHAAGAEAAGPGNDAHLYADSGRGAVSGRNQPAPEPDSDHVRALVLVGGRVVKRQDSQAVSEGPADQLYQSAKTTPSGAGYQVLQSEIAVGSGGIWGKGAEKGHADAGLFSADSLHGLHLCGIQRGTRVCGRGFCAAAILPNIDAFDSKRSNSRRPARFPHYYGNRGCVDLSDCGQRRHGHRALCPSPESLYL